MNLQQSKDLFIKTILPFGLVGGLVIFLYSLALYFLDFNPLAGTPFGYRDFDLLLFIIFLMVLLVRYNYKFPGNAPFWEIFFISFISALVALITYLIFTFILCYISPGLLNNLAEANRDFLIKSEPQVVDQVGQKGFLILLKNIKVIKPSDLFLSEMGKKGIVLMVLSAIISIIFRFSNAIFLRRGLNSKA